MIIDLKKGFDLFILLSFIYVLLQHYFSSHLNFTQQEFMVIWNMKINTKKNFSFAILGKKYSFTDECDYEYLK